MNSAADRNLLFGILALQLDFISRDALVTAMNAWVLEKQRSIGEILQSQGQLSAERLKLLDSLVAEHIRQHGGNAEASLQALSSVDAVRKSLMQVRDADVEASLTVIGSKSQLAEPEATFVPERSGPTVVISSRQTGDSMRFRILRPHAKGGLGQVSVALDEELNREVALKEIQNQFADHADSRARFVLEAEVTGGLEHPGIVPVYGLGQYDDGRPYYAMRFIKGDSLKEAIEAFHCTHLAPRDAAAAAPEPGTPASEAQNATRVAQGVSLAEREKYNGLAFRKLLGRFIDVCHAISYAHSRGVLHRDLKPGNIMLGKYGETLVVDWGLAKLKGRNETATSDERTLQPSSGSGVTPTVMGSAVGTPAYMSPEQASGKLDELGPATDVYSLGATLYHVLTGHAPFRGTDQFEVVKQVQTGQFANPHSVQAAIPRSLDAICVKAMSLNPSDRYSSPQHLAEDIERFLADEPVSAIREPLSVRARRWVRKHQTQAVTTAAVLLVSSVGLGVFSTIVSGKNSELVAANTRERNAKSAAESAKAEAETATNQAQTAQRLAETNEKSAREQSQLALSTLTSVVQELSGGLRKVQGGEQVRRRLITIALDRLTAVSVEYTSQASVDRSVMLAFRDMGDVLIFIGAGDSDVDRAILDQLQPSDRHATASELTELYLKRAIEIGEELMSKTPTDSQVKREVADCYYRLSRFVAGYGRQDDALAFANRGIVVLKSLDAEILVADDVQFELSNIIHCIGEIHSKQQHLDLAIADYEQAASIRKTLVDKTRTDAFTFGLANTRRRIGESHRAAGRLDEALDEFQKCAEVYKQLAKVDPEHPHYVDNAVFSLADAAGIYSKLGRTAEALLCLEECVAIRRERGESDPENPTKQVSLSIALVSLGDLQLELQHFDSAWGSFNETFCIRKLLFDADSANDVRRWDLAQAYDRLGTVARKRGQLTNSLENYQSAFELYRANVEADPAHTGKQQNLAIAHLRLTEILSDLSRHEEALPHFDGRVQIRRKLLALQVGNPEKQADLADSLSEYGNALLNLERVDLASDAFNECSTIRQAHFDVDAGNADKRWALAHAFDRLAAVAQKRGQLDAALQQSQFAFDHYRANAEADPLHVGKQRSLGYAHQKMREILSELNCHEEALPHFEAQVQIRRKLSGVDASNPAKQIDLAQSLVEYGDALLKLDRLDQAAEAYQECFTIRRTLVHADSANAGKRWDLAQAFDRLGIIDRKRGQLTSSLENYRSAYDHYRANAEADPSHVGKQQSLAYAHLKMTEILSDLHRHDAAIVHHEGRVKILRVLADADARDTRKQVDVVTALDQYGDWLLQLHRTDDAAKIFEEAVTRCRAVCELNPGIAEWQRYLALSDFKVGQTEEARDRFLAAADAYERGAKILRAMIDNGINVEATNQDLPFWENAAANARLAEAALGDWVTLLQKPAEELPRYLDVRGIQCCKRKRFADAEQAAAKLCELPNVDNGKLYNAACVFSLCATAIKPVDGAELSAEDTTRRQELLTKSLAALKQSIDKGWTDFDHMQKDSDLAPLRELPEFKALIPVTTEVPAEKPAQDKSEQPALKTAQ